MSIRSSIGMIQFVTLILTPAFAWHPPGNAASEKLVLTGASTIAPLASEIGRPGVR